MNHYIEYENGQSKYGEFEVMLESTAILFSGAPGNGSAVEADYAEMLRRVKGIHKLPKPKYPSYEAWYLATYNRLPA